MVLLSDCVWVYGGLDDLGTERSSLWRLNVPDDWEQVGEWSEYADQEAGPRSKHCSAVLNERAFVWGGEDGMIYAMCIYIYICLYVYVCICVYIYIHIDV